MIYFLIILILMILLIVPNIFIVNQAHLYVIERLGKYSRTVESGVHIKAPVIDRIVKKITIKEQILDSPPQPVITKDNVTLQVDSVIYFYIFNAKLYAYGVVEPMLALSNISATILRNVVGEMTLDESLTSRDSINANLTAVLDAATDAWGIKVTRVEIKNIIPPDEIRMAMEKQMKAERDKRQIMLEAEAYKESSITRAEGEKQAMILSASGQRDAKIALAEGEAKSILYKQRAEAEGIKLLKEAGLTEHVLLLKKYEALATMANGQATKLVIPTDVVDMTNKSALFSEVTGIGE